MNQKPTLSERVQAIRLKIKAKQAGQAGQQPAAPSDFTSIDIDPSREKNGGSGPPVRIVSIDSAS